MSALARYFKSMGKTVSGYDKTRTELTEQLEKEGIPVHYTDKGTAVLNELDRSQTLVIFTPAIPASHGELNALKDRGYEMIKRARALGIISNAFTTFAVAGTHGKTTTSTILAHVLHQTKEGVNAFIGGISSNYNSNCIINAEAERVVVEADEFDRSFLQLRPNFAIVTSMDADHLDIYGDKDHLTRSFEEFMRLVSSSGLVLLHAGLKPNEEEIKAKVIRYGFHVDADWKGTSTSYEDGKFFFDVTHGGQEYRTIELGLPGKHNAENALAVFALCMELGIEEALIRDALASFKGVKRRFEFHIRTEDLVIIDDYAHHPAEIEAFISSVRLLYPGRKLTAVFQPHLFSRTRDFMEGFGQSLSLADEVILLPIYPAREEPIPGITSEVILNCLTTPGEMSSLNNVVMDLHKLSREVILIIGAGDIDTVVSPIVKSYLNEKVD